MPALSLAIPGRYDRNRDREPPTLEGRAEMDIDLRKVRYFMAVARRGNFSRAAEDLYIAQPVLSRQIRALESELGAVLFIRDRSGAVLTEAGTQLAADAEPLLADAEALGRRVAQAARKSGQFTVAFMPGLIVTDAVRAFAAAHPELTVEVLRTSRADQAQVLHDGRGRNTSASAPSPTSTCCSTPTSCPSGVTWPPRCAAAAGSRRPSSPTPLRRNSSRSPSAAASSSCQNPRPACTPAPVSATSRSATSRQRKRAWPGPPPAAPRSSPSSPASPSSTRSRRNARPPRARARRAFYCGPDVI